MRKIIEANIDKQDLQNEKIAKNQRNAFASLAAMSFVSNSSKNRDRRKLLNDIMYYLRKLINLAKQVQSLSEGTLSQDNDNLLFERFDKIKLEIDELEEFISIREKP